MSRLQPYRNRVPTHIIKLLDVSSRITLFLVGQNGPLSFIFKDRLQNKFKTSIGAEIKCSCSGNKNDHCIHSLYVLLKIFKVSVQNPIIWQASYIDSELTDLLAGKHSVIANKRRVNRPIFEISEEHQNVLLPSDVFAHKDFKKNFAYLQPQEQIQAMLLQQDSVCPICQQQMKPTMCLTHCKIGCGNNYHLQCLKVWVGHKKNEQSKITCPMCRQQFKLSIFQQLKHQEIQFKKKEVVKKMYKYQCSSCGLDQITKNVHKCLLCQKFQLCQACYIGNKHIKHPFVKRNQLGSWQGAQERRPGELKIKQFIDNKRQQSKNKQVLQKLRSTQQSPSNLLDYICSSYPYVSKYISQNIDPYHKLNLQPEQMQCQKCGSKRMIFLRRLPCGHFLDHQCLKQNLRKQIMYCQKDGSKLLKGYQNLLQKSKQMQYQEQKVEWQVDDAFNIKHIQKIVEQQNQSQSNTSEIYNFAQISQLNRRNQQLLRQNQNHNIYSNNPNNRNNVRRNNENSNRNENSNNRNENSNNRNENGNNRNERGNNRNESSNNRNREFPNHNLNNNITSNNRINSRQNIRRQSIQQINERRKKSHQAPNRNSLLNRARSNIKPGLPLNILLSSNPATEHLLTQQPHIPNSSKRPTLSIHSSSVNPSPMNPSSMNPSSVNSSSRPPINNSLSSYQNRINQINTIQQQLMLFGSNNNNNILPNIIFGSRKGNNRFGN